MKLSSSILVVLLFAQSLWAQDVEKLNQQIREAGAEWEAGDTSVNGLTQAEKAGMLDKQLIANPEVAFEVPEMFQAMAASKFDWRNKDGKNWMSPIRNQGTCGSCVAFAATGAMEIQYRISHANAASPISLSPSQLFSCGGGACNRGWFPETAAQFLQSKGVVDEACMPYTSARGKDAVCSKACANAAQRTRRISSFSRPTRVVRKIENIKSALAKGPLVTTLRVYSDFYSYKRGVYKHVSGKLEGGHAVVLVGYDDSQRYFIIRNSWATSWGEGGYGKISYDDVSGLGADTWKYEVSSKIAADPGLDEMSSSSSWSVKQTVANYYHNEVQPMYLERGTAARNTESEKFLKLALETQELASYRDLTFVQRRAGFADKRIPVTADGSTLLVTIDTDLLSKGDWDFFFEGRQIIEGQERVVTSDKVAFTAK